MNASKEACRKASTSLENLVSKYIPNESSQDDDLLVVQNFLSSAEKKLPSEASFEKEKKKHSQAK